MAVQHDPRAAACPVRPVERLRQRPDPRSSAREWAPSVPPSSGAGSPLPHRRAWPQDPCRLLGLHALVDRDQAAYFRGGCGLGGVRPASGPPLASQRGQKPGKLILVESNLARTLVERLLAQVELRLTPGDFRQEPVGRCVVAGQSFNRTRVGRRGSRGPAAGSSAKTSCAMAACEASAVRSDDDAATSFSPNTSIRWRPPATRKPTAARIRARAAGGVGRVDRARIGWGMTVIPAEATTLGRPAGRGLRPHRRFQSRKHLERVAQAGRARRGLRSRARHDVRQGIGALLR